MASSPWLTFAVAIAAGAIAAVSGFGIGSLLTPLLILTLPAESAVAVVALPHAWASGLRLWRLRHSVHGPTFRQFGLASAVGGLLGAVLQAKLSSPLLTGLLAGLLLLAGATELARRPIPIPPGQAWRLLDGWPLGGLRGTGRESGWDSRRGPAGISVNAHADRGHRDGGGSARGWRSSSGVCCSPGGRPSPATSAWRSCSRLESRSGLPSVSPCCPGFQGHCTGGCSGHC